jgi:LPXTG-motif cell wall-anchored protein
VPSRDGSGVQPGAAAIAPEANPVAAEQSKGNLDQPGLPRTGASDESAIGAYLALLILASLTVVVRMVRRHSKGSAPIG